jgi:hypothetical protein
MASLAALEAFVASGPVRIRATTSALGPFYVNIPAQETSTITILYSILGVAWILKLDKSKA